MKDRDDVEESRFERLLRAADPERVDPALLAWDRWVERSGLRSLIDQSLEAEILKEGFIIGHREGYLTRLLDEASEAAQEQVQAPVPEAVTEQVERPLDGGAAEERVAGPAPLGEAQLDQGPEVEGVGGAGELKMHTWSEHLRIYTTHGTILTYRDRWCIGGLPVGPEVAASANDAEPILCSEILRLANRVRDLEETLRTIQRRAVVHLASGWTSDMSDIRNWCDQALSSSGSNGGDGAT